MVEPGPLPTVMNQESPPNSRDDSGSALFAQQKTCFRALHFRDVERPAAPRQLMRPGPLCPFCGVWIEPFPIASRQSGVGAVSAPAIPDKL